MVRRSRSSAPSSATSAFRADATSPSGLRSSQSIQGPRIKIIEDLGDVKGLAYQILSLQQVREVNECDCPEDLEKKVLEILEVKESETELRQAAKVDYFVAGLHWAKEQGFTNMQLSGFYTLVHICLQNLEDGMSLEENWKELKKYFVGIGENSSEEFGAQIVRPEESAYNNTNNNINTTSLSLHQTNTGTSLSGATPGSSTSGGHRDGTPGGVTPGVTPVRMETPVSMAPPSGGLDFFDLKQSSGIIDYVSVTLFQHYRLYEYTFHREQEEVSISQTLKVGVPPEASLPYPNPLEEAVENDVFYKLLQRPSSSPKPLLPSPGDSSPPLPSDVVAAQLVGDVKSLVDSTTKDLFGEVENEVAYKLKERENQYINKINKIHRISPSPSPG